MDELIIYKLYKCFKIKFTLTYHRNFKNISYYFIQLVSNCPNCSCCKLFRFNCRYGYSVTTYFKYSLLNLLGISVKFIPLSFLISLSIFVIKHLQDNEFIILWTSGVKKISLVKILVLISIFISIIYLIFSTFLTPLSLNKSRNILNNNNFNSFCLP